MKKIKIFKPVYMNDGEALEQEVNKWLSENKLIDIISFNPVVMRGEFIQIQIVYNENPPRRER